jgi:hypothetical protein
MKTYGGGGMAPCILSVGTEPLFSRPGRGESALGIHCIGGWLGPEPASTLWRNKESLATAGNRTVIPQSLLHFTPSCILVRNF